MAQSSHHTNVCFFLYASVIFAFQRQPTELLPHLFIGDEQDSSNKEVLDKIGITAILNVSNTCQSLFTSQYTYKVIPVQDKNNENILVWFAEAIQFIGELSYAVRYKADVLTGLSFASGVHLYILSFERHLHFQSTVDTLSFSRVIL